MKKIYFYVLAVFCVMVGIVGCGSSSPSPSGKEVSTKVVVSDCSPIDPNGNIRPKVLEQLRAKRLPDPVGSVATLQPIEKMVFSERARVSSDDFYRILKRDLAEEEAEVILWFYAKPDYEEYLGCRTLSAKKFFEGQVSETLEARSYWIYATTYSPCSGYCFSSQMFITLLPGDNQVQLDFHPSGSFKVPCYISNPPGIYSSDSWSAELKNSGHISFWDTPCYNAEKNKLEISLYYSDLYGNPGNFYDKKLKLRINGEDGLHILEFTFNPMDIISHARPLELIAREIPTGTAGYGGKFGFEDREITINLDPNQTVNLPLAVAGTAPGIKKVIVELHNETREGYYDEVIEVDPNGNYASEIPLLAAPGDRLCISVWDWSRISDPMVAMEVDGVTVNVKVGDIFVLKKDNSIPDGTIEKPSGYAGQIGSPAGTFVANLTAELQGAKVSCYTADFSLGAMTRSLTLWKNGVQLGASLSPLSDMKIKIYTFEVGELSLQKGDIIQLQIDPNDSLEKPVFIQMEVMVEGTTLDGTCIKTPYIKGQEICIVPPMMITRDTSFSDASADSPTPFDSKTGLINLGAYVVTVYGSDFEATDFLVSTKTPVLLGKYLEGIMLVRRDMEAQVGSTIMYPPDNGVTPVAYSFHDESLLIPKEYKFQLYATKHAGIDIPVEFQFQFSVVGTTALGYKYQTPFKDGQKIYIAPSCTSSPTEGSVVK